MVYTTELLNPMWWIDSLFGDVFIFVAIVEFFLLSFIRKIPNITLFSVILLAINGFILLFAFAGSEGLTMGTGALTLLIVIYAFIAWTAYNDS